MINFFHRSFPIVYLKDSEVSGIHTYAFHLPDNVFANHTINPDNYGFCPNGVCLGNGVLNISKCAKGFNLLIWLYNI